MITREILSDLIGFNPEPYLTTTLYLRIESSARPGFVIQLKDLIKEQKKELEAQDMPDDRRESVLSDLKKMQDFVSMTFTPQGTQTLVIASCSAKKLWVVLNLKLQLQGRLVVRPRPHYRPLALALADHHRFLVIMIDRARARMYEVFAGEIHDHKTILDEVPKKVKEGGFNGYEERRIARHIEDHVRRHYKRAAENAHDLYTRFGCEYVILGGTEINLGEFQHFLQTPLSDRVAGTFNEEPHCSETVVLQHALSIEQDLKRKEEQQLLNRFFDQVNSGGLGILGLDSVMVALRQGQVNILLVQEGFQAEGLEQTIDEAMEQGCQVKYISQPNTQLASVGVGALLRFKVQERASASAS